VGADVNKTVDEGGTPLFIAAYQGNEAMVRALIEAGADINKALLDGGETPLFIAAHQGHEAAVRAMIELGADVSKAENNGVTPLSVAAQEGHTAIVQILRDAVLVQMRNLSL
jgi:cytohesin